MNQDGQLTFPFETPSSLCAAKSTQAHSPQAISSKGEQTLSAKVIDFKVASTALKDVPRGETELLGRILKRAKLF
jgi:hypothetical protein